MAKYLIHACLQREWYVNEYLIPSMTDMGISRDDIYVYMDKDSLGCLESCMRAFASVPLDDKGTWHLQDDVVLCRDFKDRTECLSDLGFDIICGYCFEKGRQADKIGRVGAVNMWYSFPCIYISNKIARHCADWFYRYVVHENCFGVYVRSKKHDDTLFHMFAEDYYPNVNIFNLTPNLVDHVDYLIGGSIINYIRDEKETPALYFYDKSVVTELKERLKQDKKIVE